jgi:hypothetical protein
MLSRADQKGVFWAEQHNRSRASNAFNDLTKGPGENNEVVKALKSNSEWTGGPNSSQLIGGPNSMINMDKFGVVLTRS